MDNIVGGIGGVVELDVGDRVNVSRVVFDGDRRVGREH